MNPDRDRILSAIRRQSVPPEPLPSGAGPWIQYASPRDQFIDVLRSVGGEAQVVQDADDLARAIDALPAYQRATQRCCELDLSRCRSVAPTLDWNVRVDEVHDPHALESVDLAVMWGHFGVAENAAIWVTDRKVRQRAIYFITQHLALVVPASDIVNNMHEAYEHLSFDDNVYGCFISGPSKTADIEQSLVVGAHGPRSLHVFLVQDADSCRPG